MVLPRRADGVIDGADWDIVMDAIEARLGVNATGDLLMADTTLIKTGIVDDDLFYIHAVDNDTNTLKLIAGAYGATDPYWGMGGSAEWKFYNGGTAVFGTLASNWDAGAVEIRAATFESDIATGTAPFTIASTTLVDNLNADLLDGNEAADFPLLTTVVLRDGTQALTANWDVGAYTITGTQFISDIAIGTSPLVVTSTTVVSNLNADLLDGEEGAYYAVDSAVLKKDGSVALTGDWDAGGFDIRAQTGTFDSLTSGRVPFASANGLLIDDADFTFATDTLTVTKIGAFTSTGTIESENAAGYALLNEAATGINPTLVPDKSDPHTGIGRVGNDAVSIIGGGKEIIRGQDFDALGNITTILGGTITSSNANGRALDVSVILNDSNAPSGTDLFNLIKGDITETDITGWDNINLMDLQVDTVSKLTIDHTGQIISGVAAGSPVMKFTATSDTPTAAWSDYDTNDFVVSTVNAGWMEVDVGGTPYYIPYWA